MGMVTVIVINNDRLHNIRDNPKFGEVVWDSATGFSRSDLSKWTAPANPSALTRHGYGYVVSVDHVDSEQYILVHRQDTRILTYEEIADIEKARSRSARKAEKEREEKP